MVSQLVPYFAMAGRFAAITAILYFTGRAIALVVTVIVALTTRDEKRSEACVKIVDSLCRGWPWPPRLPGSHG